MSDINQVITEADLMAHLGIDYTDDIINANLKQAIEYADGELRESVDDNYPVDHPLVSELALIHASASYEKRDLAKNESKRADQIAMKLCLYLRRAKNEQSI